MAIVRDPQKLREQFSEQTAEAPTGVMTTGRQAYQAGSQIFGNQPDGLSQFSRISGPIQNLPYSITLDERGRQQARFDLSNPLGIIMSGRYNNVDDRKIVEKLAQMDPTFDYQAAVNSGADAKQILQHISNQEYQKLSQPKEKELTDSEKLAREKFELDRRKILGEEAMKAESEAKMQTAINAELKDNLSKINNLIENKEGLKRAVGGTRFTRESITSAGLKVGLTAGLALPGEISARFQNVKDDYVAEVENLLSSKVLDTLIQAKDRGATFGALSNEELRLLAASASAIGQAAILKDGKVVGYDMSEKKFKENLNLLKDKVQKAIQPTTDQLPTTKPMQTTEDFGTSLGTQRATSREAAGQRRGDIFGEMSDEEAYQEYLNMFQ